MSKISFSFSLPIVLAGFFVLVVALALALSYEVTGVAVYAIFLLLAVAVFLFGWAIGQNFANSIKKMLAWAEGLARGEVQGRLHVEAKDEFGELAKALNDVAKELETRRMDARIFEHSMNTKVKAKTEALEETIFALEQKVRNRTLEMETIKSRFVTTVARKREKTVEPEQVQEL